jgi:phosphate/sulfate permease
MTEIPNTPPKPNPILGLVIIAVIVFICYLIFSPPNSTTQDTKNSTSDSIAANKDKIESATPGEQLAEVELKQGVTTVSPYSKKLDALLNDLSHKYQQPADSIANLTFQTRELLITSGINMTFEYILNDVNQIPKMENTSYKNAIGLWGYTTLKVNSKKQ